MTVELAVPDPRYAPVPVGWCEMVAEPVIEAAESFDELDEIEGKLLAVMALVESTRRDATEFQKGLLCTYARKGELAGPGGQGRRTDLNAHVKVPEHTSAMTVTRWRKIAEHWRNFLRKHVFYTDDPRKLSQTFLLKLVKEKYGDGPATIRVAEGTDDQHGDGWTMLYGKAAERAADIEPGSVDLILTDPPYPKEELPRYGELAVLAARLLKHQGVLLAYAGNLYEPEIYRLMEHPDLHFGWAFTLLMDEGSQSRIMGRHIVQGAKHILAYSKGPWPSGAWMFDPIRNPNREKNMYEWQQGEEPARVLIEQFTPEGAVVLDPFVGVGTFGMAALATGRQFIGVELDSGRYATAADRLRSHLAH